MLIDFVRTAGFPPGDMRNLLVRLEVRRAHKAAEPFQFPVGLQQRLVAKAENCKLLQSSAALPAFDR